MHAATHDSGRSYIRALSASIPPGWAYIRALGASIPLGWAYIRALGASIPPGWAYIRALGASIPFRDSGMQAEKSTVFTWGNVNFPDFVSNSTNLTLSEPLPTPPRLLSVLAIERIVLKQTCQLAQRTLPNECHTFLRSRSRQCVSPPAPK